MNSESTQIDRKLWYIFGFVFLLVFFNSAVRIFNADEFEAIHSSWKVLNSGVIFRDFFQHHHPLLYFIDAPIIALFGENVGTLYVLRATALLTVLGIFLVTYLIALKLFDRRTAIMSIVLLVSIRIFIERAIEVRPDTPQVFFGMLCILFLFSFYQKRSYRDLILSSASLAISLLFLQKAVFLVFLIGCVLTVDLLRRELTIKDVLLYIIVFVATLTPFFIYIVATGTLDNYVFFAWIINMDLPASHSTLNVNLKTLRRNTLMWAFYLPGLWLVLKSNNRDAIRLRLAALSFGLLACVFSVKIPTPQYYMHAIPLISIVAAFALTTFFARNHKRLLILVLIGTFIPALALLKRPFKKPNFAQLDSIRYVLSITDRADDRVYDPGVFYNPFREDSHFFWMVIIDGSTDLTTKITMNDFNGFVPCETIEKVKPVVVIEILQESECAYIKTNYKRSEKYKDMFVRADRG